MKQVASGVSGDSQFSGIILAALDRDEYGAPPFEMPDSVEQVQVDAISGYPAHDDFPARTDFAIRYTPACFYLIQFTQIEIIAGVKIN